MRCLRCGYVLEGLSENRCPECASEFDPRDRNTFDDELHRLTTAKRCLTLSVACCAYAMMVVASIIGGVVARFSGNDAVMTLAEVAFSFLICFSPAVFLIHVGIMIGALCVAAYGRHQLWARWWVLAGIGAVSWMSAFLTLFVFLGVLMI